MINPLGDLLAVIHRDGGQDILENGLETSTEKAIELINNMRAAMQEFCDRVESGEVRSSYTYAKFKGLLES